MTGQRFFADAAGSHVIVPGEPGKVIGVLFVKGCSDMGQTWSLGSNGVAISRPCGNLTGFADDVFAPSGDGPIFATEPGESLTLDVPGVGGYRVMGFLQYEVTETN
jgi:hypothetical protein